MKAITRKFFAYLDDMQIITILLPNNYFGGSSSHFSIKKMNRGEHVLLTIINRIPLENSVKYICQIEEKLVIGYFSLKSIRKLSAIDHEIDMGRADKTKNIELIFIHKMMQY